ncbi:MAG TPA: NAD(P)H-dependent oxidoreductase [Anaerolineales bacterium]|nr:NAD(P)H-dependent oxidoreductase [Anaerolineales bacterium]
MKALILDGAPANDLQATRIANSLRKQLPYAETILLREQRIGNCAGDFFCWVRSPGMCNANDDNRIIAAKIIQSDLVIYLTPVTFGGYSSELKRMVDHQIQNISPFFTSVQGEIHHQRRYKQYPNMLTIGWMDEPDVHAEAIFRHLAHRNAVNMYAKTSVCGLVIGTPPAADLDDRVESWLQAIAKRSNSPVPALPTMDVSPTAPTPVKRAVLLVGSPRAKKSTSASLGDYLFEQLNIRGVESQTIQIYTAIHSQERMNAMYEAIESADLVILAFPIYVDSLPAPVTAALEKIALNQKYNPSAFKFAAIANCGFPEAHQNETALAICAEFSRQSGLAWMGSLALGGGEGIVHGVPLHQMDGRAIPLKKALDLAAEALANGQPIPQAARDLLSKPMIPSWIYKLIGGLGWKQQAKHYGTQKELKRQPYL